MDIQGQHPDATPAPEPIPATATLNEAGKPSVEMSDAQAESLLALTGVQTSIQPKRKLPLGLILTILVLVVLLILSTSLIGHFGHSGGSNPLSAKSSGSNQSKAPTDEINKDVQSCSNVVNALSEC